MGCRLTSLHVFALANEILRPDLEQRNSVALFGGGARLTSPVSSGAPEGGFPLRLRIHAPTPSPVFLIPTRRAARDLPFDPELLFDISTDGECYLEPAPWWINGHVDRRRADR